MLNLERIQQRLGDRDRRQGAGRIAGAASHVSYIGWPRTYGLLWVVRVEAGRAPSYAALALWAPGTAGEHCGYKDIQESYHGTGYYLYMELMGSAG